MTATSQTSDLNNAVTAISWGAEDWDSDGFWSSGNPTRLTIPPGISKVILRGNVRWVAANFRRDMIMKKNGADFSGHGDVQFISATGAPTIEGMMNATSGIISVAPGDYFELDVFQNSGSTQKVDNQPETWFEVQVVQ